METKLQLGIVGLGARGASLIRDVYLQHPEVEITAVCDVYADRAEEAADTLAAKYGRRPRTTTDARALIQMPEVEGVILCTAWDHHVDLCLAAMEAGKPVAVEVGGAYSVHECWRLVDAYERTHVPVMLLENCVFGRDELMIRNMAEQGVFGRIVHAQGGYCHDLRDEIGFGRENRHYRLDNYLRRNTENYPTHELGPIAKILKINHGNRMLSLRSLSSGAFGMEDYIARAKPEDTELMGRRFAQGDVVHTLISCAGGETILLKLDTTLPRFYSRGLMIQGTRGMYEEDNGSIYLDEERTSADHFDWQKHWGNIEKYRDRYEHPIWQRYLKEGVKAGHGGMDWLVFCDFVDTVLGRKAPEIDVYDMAAWMSISALAEESIALGGHPVAIPDFTGGQWIHG